MSIDGKYKASLKRAKKHTRKAGWEGGGGIHSVVMCSLYVVNAVPRSDSPLCSDCIQPIKIDRSVDRLGLVSTPAIAWVDGAGCYAFVGRVRRTERVVYGVGRTAFHALGTGKFWATAPQDSGHRGV